MASPSLRAPAPPIRIRYDRIALLAILAVSLAWTAGGDLRASSVQAAPVERAIAADRDAHAASRTLVRAAPPVSVATNIAWTADSPTLTPTDPAVLAAEAERVRLAAEQAAAQQVAAQQAADAQAAAQQAAATKAADKAARAAKASAAAASAPAAPAATPDADAVKDYASGLVGGGQQFACLESLWQKESGWNYQAANKSSGAYGIPQALPGSKMASAGADWKTNPQTQVRWGLSYIAGRYGTPCDAWASFQSKGWY